MRLSSCLIAASQLGSGVDFDWAVATLEFLGHSLKHGYTEQFIIGSVPARCPCLVVAKSAQVIEVCAKLVYGQTCPLKTFPEKGVKTITAFRF